MTIEQRGDQATENIAAKHHLERGHLVEAEDTLKCGRKPCCQRAQGHRRCAHDAVDDKYAQDRGEERDKRHQEIGGEPVML